ncbi:biotin--[acetyl-CoA-carboxylase] ligase [Luteimonas sp. e5]
MPSASPPSSPHPERILLQRLAAGPVSGDALAHEFGLTRAAVWKRIEALRQAGIAIQARRGQGYALTQALDLLDAAAIRAALPDALHEALELDVAWQVDSTNSVLLARPAPVHGVRVLLAERQSRGRGRLGRDWHSPLAANVYLSLDRRYGAGLARLPGLSLVAGIASAEALRVLTGLDIGLKWPNDLWLDGRKLGGLLVEGSGEHGGSARAVIGLGLNLRMPASQTARIAQPWTDLAAHLPAPPARNQVVAALLAAWLPALEAFDRDGLAGFLPRWQALDVLAGQPVDIIEGGTRVPALALGVAADGGLRIRDARGERILHSGEVSVRMAA